MSGRFLMPEQVVTFHDQLARQDRTGTIVRLRSGPVDAYEVNADGRRFWVATNGVTPVMPPRPVERSHVEIGIRGGQSHTGAELEQAGTTLVLPVALAVAAVVGCAVAEAMSRAAVAAGPLFS